MSISRRMVVIGGVVAIVGVAATYPLFHQPFPPDTTPEGAYMRIAKSVTEDDPKAFFAYLETEAQWACYTLRDMRKEARARVIASYPGDEEKRLADEYAPYANAPDGSDVFAYVYRARNWSRRMRKDLSGVARVDREGDRASVVTVQGTRWPFRRRDNGIWGLTMFTAELLADAEKSTRDLAVVTAAASDYERLKAVQGREDAGR
jgi:hypothetical protein